MNVLRRARQLRWQLLWVVGLLVLLVGGWKLSSWWNQQRGRSALRFSVPRSPDQVINHRPVVVRGPYLQRLTPTAVVIRWRTNIPVLGSVVLVGPSQPSQFADPVGQRAAPGPRIEHEIQLAGLTPATRYEYKLMLGETSVWGSPRPWQFETWPTHTPDAPVRVWVLGDSGTASPGARAVFKAYLEFAQQTLPHVWLMLGDNAYNSGTDEEYQAGLFDMYPDMLARVCLWPSRGNHDKARAFGRAPFFDVFTMPTQGEAGGAPSHSPSYYAFDYADIHFVNLDSYASDRASDGAMVAWLKRDLAQAHARWRIVYFHHPPYSRGTHNSDYESAMVQMRRNVVPVLEAGGVDLVLTGHSHNYERSALISGHYGPSSTFEARHTLASGGAGAVFQKRAGPGGGTVYVVAGASGELGERFDGLDHPAMDVSSATLGSVVLDIGHENARRLPNERGQDPR